MAVVAAVAVDCFPGWALRAAADRKLLIAALGVANDVVCLGIIVPSGLLIAVASQLRFAVNQLRFAASQLRFAASQLRFAVLQLQAAAVA
jgi:hypothetical protein